LPTFPAEWKRTGRSLIDFCAVPFNEIVQSFPLKVILHDPHLPAKFMSYQEDCSPASK